MLGYKIVVLIELIKVDCIIDIFSLNLSMLSIYYFYFDII